MRILNFCTLLLYLSIGPAFADEIDRVSFFRLIISEQNKNLFSFKSHLGCPNTSIGDYLGLLLANGTAGDVYKIGFSCKIVAKQLPINAGSFVSNTHWFCRVRAYSSDRNGVSPWQYDLLFLVDKKTRKINQDYIYCSGAP